MLRAIKVAQGIEFVSFLASEDPGRADGRAYSVREVARARWFLRFFRQTPVATAVQVTLS